MQTLLILVELFVSIALVVVILLQRSEGGALGMGGGGSGLGGLFSPRGAADTLTRTTGILAIMFFVTCLALNLMALRGRDEHSILEGSPTVLIQNMMAARMGDPTVHGGVIVKGEPTVMIGIPGQGAVLQAAAEVGTPLCAK